MDQVSFDTHAAARRLVQAGATDRLAEAVVETVAEATRTNMQILEDLAFLKHQGADTASQSELQNTNTGIAVLKADVSRLKVDVSRLKVDVAQLKVDVAQLKTDVAQLKVDVAQLKTDMAILQTDLSSFKQYVMENMVTKKDLFRVLWIQNMSMLAVWVALLGVALWFVDFTLGKT